MACTCSQCRRFQKASAPEGFRSGYCSLLKKATTDADSCQHWKAAGGVFAADIGLTVEPNGLVISQSELRNYTEAYVGEVSKGFGES
jgi:hypothetical protein